MSLAATAQDAAKTPILTVRGLRTMPEGRVGRAIHDDLDLDLYAGETLVLLGESGSGKTTFLRTLVGLERAIAGSCEFEGQDLYALSEAGWRPVRTKIAFAFQGGALFDSLSVGENLEFPLLEHTRMPPRERRERVRTQLEALGLSGTSGLMPSELSGGMQKRAGVARAIILGPKIVLYDEPTAGLDPENIHRMNETILALKGPDKASIVVTHDSLCALAVADRFAFLAGGKVAATQSRADFDRDPHPLLQAYFEGASAPSRNVSSAHAPHAAAAAGESHASSRP